MKKILIASTSLAALSTASFGAAFTPGDIVVDRVGTGSGSLSSNATAVFIDEYSPTGTLVQSIALPTAASGSQHAYTQSGSATSEGQLTLSPNGQYLAVMGYSATPGTSGVSSSSSSSDPRTVAIIGASGSVDTTTALGDAASGNNPRSAVTTDGNSIWVAGAASGIRYTTDGSTSSTELNTTDVNFETVEAVGGQLYASSQKLSINIATIGTGLPTTAGQTIANLPGLPTGDASFGFFLADLNGATSPNTLYVADSTNGIEKYSLEAGSWTATGSVALSNVTGLTGEVEGGDVELFATTPTTIYSLADNSGLDGTLSGSLDSIATASTNEAFRGVEFAPVAAAVPEPATWATMLSGLAALILFRSRRNRARGVLNH
jgi:hypothetical protein